MLTMQGLTLLNNTELFAKKMDCGSLPIRPTHLISYVKKRLKGMVFPSYEKLLNAIGEVVIGIESEILTAVFEHWMERLELVSKNNGDDYP
jgi:hypothetical protein